MPRHAPFLRQVSRTERYRLGPWRGRDDVGYLAPAVGSSAPSIAGLRSATDELHGMGFMTVHSAAVGETETDPYVGAGYVPRERLHLLRHDLGPELDAAFARPHPSTLRRARRRDHGPVLELDQLAFDRFWVLDPSSLDEALTATRRARFRVSEIDGDLAGYAITGRSGPVGYLQRLGVAPEHHGRGIGGQLVLDALDWLRRRGATHVMVNTQEQNERALGLYERLGFVRQEHGLIILSHHDVR